MIKELAYLVSSEVFLLGLQVAAILLGPPALVCPHPSLLSLPTLSKHTSPTG